MMKVPFYTYTLGRSLYVPLTCRCNSRTLPETRGPSFALPAEIVAALCRFRDLECNDQRWSHWCNWLDTQEMNQVLPEPMERSNAIECSDEVESIIKAEVQAQLERKDWNEINFGGEGEPTLNLQALESLSKEFGSQIPIKVRTNGLIDCASLLKDWGVTSVSVALMTHDPSQYNDFMEPLADTTPGAAAAHDQMCAFVESALACNLEVELTGVDRSEVDKEKAQDLATSLGVEAEIRWRPYFP